MPSEECVCVWGGVFLRDPNPYLPLFRRKPLKIPEVDQRDQEVNLVPVFRLPVMSEEPLDHWWGVVKIEVS